MHLIMILIRWLAGLISGGESIALRGWSRASSEIGIFLFRYGSNGAYSSGIGEMKVNHMLVKLHGLLGRRPALAFISPSRRGLLCVNPYQPECFVVETALLSPNFPPPVPRDWG